MRSAHECTVTRSRENCACCARLVGCAVHTFSTTPAASFHATSLPSLASLLHAMEKPLSSRFSQRWSDEGADVSCAADVVVGQKLVHLDVGFAGISLRVRNHGPDGLITCEWELFSQSARQSGIVHRASCR